MRPILLVVAVALALCVNPALAQSATLHATPSTFAATFSSAQGGDTILLAAGSYGTFNGAAKTGMVTIDEEAGASASFSGSTFSAARNLTLKNVTYTGSICINPPGSGTKMNLILDGLNMGNVGQGCGEGRITIRGGGGGTSAIDGNGVQIKNSVFGPGGCSDGIQDISNGTEIGPGNEFKNITQGSCAPAHVDSIQPYAANYTHIHDNYIHDSEQGIQSPDGVSVGYLIENNVIHTSTGYPCMHLGNTRNGTVRHNVCRNGGIRVYGGNQNTASQNMKVQDNVTTGNDISACTGCTVDHNLNVSQVTFTGGTGRCAYATASPKGTGSDGTDIGLNSCSTGPPPPVDHTPVAAFSFSPQAPVVGQDVVFDVSASTCEDPPCTYSLTDEPGAWPIKTGPGPTLMFAFQSAGTKHATLRVTDTDGDVSAAVTHDVVVSDAPPPPPPSGCDQACVDAYEATIADRDATISDLNAELDDLQALADSRLAMIHDRDDTITALEGKLAQIHDLSAP